MKVIRDLGALVPSLELERRGNPGAVGEGNTRTGIAICVSGVYISISLLSQSAIESTQRAISWGSP